MNAQLDLFENLEVEKKKVQPRSPDGEWVQERIAKKYEKKIKALRETIKYMASLNANVIRKYEELKSLNENLQRQHFPGL